MCATRFLCDNAKEYTVPVQVESISIDASSNSTYQSRQQLPLTSCSNQDLLQDVPPLVSPKHQTKINNSNEEGSLANYHAIQDDHNQGGYRQRTAVMSSVLVDQYKIMHSKSKDNSLDKPPPLPPKSFRSRKFCTKKGTSTSSVKSVYQSGEHHENLHVVKERNLVQPSQPPIQQIKLV